MSPDGDFTGWLDVRLRDTPAQLAGAIRELMSPSQVALDAGAPGPGPSDMVDRSLAAFVEVADGPQTRDAALRLLAADALLTYAFEAAVDPAVGGSADHARNLARLTGPGGALGRLAESA